MAENRRQEVFLSRLCFVVWSEFGDKQFTSNSADSHANDERPPGSPVPCAGCCHPVELAISVMVVPSFDPINARTVAVLDCVARATAMSGGAVLVVLLGLAVVFLAILAIAVPLVCEGISASPPKCGPVNNPGSGRSTGQGAKHSMLTNGITASFAGEVQFNLLLNVQRHQELQGKLQYSVVKPVPASTAGMLITSLIKMLSIGTL